MNVARRYWVRFQTWISRIFGRRQARQCERCAAFQAWMNRIFGRRQTGKCDPCEEFELFDALPIVKAVLDDIEDGQPGLLPVSALQVPLPVEIPQWPNSLPGVDHPEYLWVYWNDIPIVERKFTSKPKPDELLIEVETKYLLHGPSTLHYEIMIHNCVCGRSKVLPLTIDREAPVLGGDEGMLVFPEEVLKNGVTAHYLELNDDKLKALVPDYDAPEVGDTITYYWNRKLNEDECAGELTLKRVDIGKPLVLVFDGKMIREREDGVRYAYYRIKDRAGNQSPRARTVDLNVAAEIAPRHLPWPELPKASGSGATLTLDLEALNGDLHGVLPEGVEIYPEDTLALQWGEPGELGSLTLEESEIKGQFLIPRDKLAMQSGKTLPFHYQVTTFDGQVLESFYPHRQVSVLAFAPHFPIPQIKEAKVGYLKLSDVTTDRAHFYIDIWTFISTDHLLRIDLKGFDSSGLVIYQVPPHQVTENEIKDRRIGGDDNIFVLKSWLETLKVGSTLQVFATVSFDGGHTWPSTPNLGSQDLQVLP